MDKATFLEFLDKYFEGTLLPEESLHLFNAMENNTEYKEEFEMEQAIKNSVILFNRKKLKEKLDANRGKKYSTRFIVRIVSIAALLFFAIIAFVIKFNSSQDELLYSGIVSYRNYEEHLSYNRLFDSIAHMQNSSVIKDFPISKENERFGQRDSIIRRIELFGSNLANKRINVILYYNKDKSDYNIKNDTVFIYFNSKDIKSINKIEIGALDTLKIYSNDKIYIVL